MSADFDSWAVVELMGHVRMAGRVTEEERFGVKLGRVDVPISGQPCAGCKGRGRVPDDPEARDPDYLTCPACDGFGEVPHGFTTVYFSGASLYRLTPTTEEIARQVARGNQPRPVHQWELPSPGRSTAVLDGEDEDDRDRSYYDRED